MSSSSAFGSDLNMFAAAADPPSRFGQTGCVGFGALMASVASSQVAAENKVVSMPVRKEYETTQKQVDEIKKMTDDYTDQKHTLLTDKMKVCGLQYTGSITTLECYIRHVWDELAKIDHVYYAAMNERITKK